ncbi:hypothetical protein GobsT_26240 [Gemmata obscuriglobus]|nr:hypothetical protein GobsT_26240 [Gemmata obscuriglobus]VTS05246.1 unnamed protein product [Gemmata obscuriglobus UQM 2246]
MTTMKQPSRDNHQGYAEIQTRLNDNGSEMS